MNTNVKEIQAPFAEWAISGLSGTLSRRGGYLRVMKSASSAALSIVRTSS